MVVGANNVLVSDAVLGEIFGRLVVALAIGALIGLERSYRGRPAGFRTHALVCLSTSLLMLLTAYEELWVPQGADVRVTLDPTRMAQGIMTGIGFLGAGAILRDGLSIRGLTTAASIWITAAIGILVGIGFWAPALMAAVLTLGTLSIFRWIEARMRVQVYAHFRVRFARAATLAEDELRRLIETSGFTIANLNYRLDAKDDSFEYRMVLRTSFSKNLRALAERLERMPVVREFRLSPTGD